MHALHADDLLGVLGSVLVFASFWMKRSIPLRTMALASNVVFIAYATVAWLVPILILHVALLPLNAARLWELWHALRLAAAPALGRHHLPMPDRAPTLRVPAEHSSEAI